MGIQGTKIPRGGHTWEVTSAKREGPQWRVSLKSVEDPRCRLQTYVEGARPPQASMLAVAVQQPQYRWFVDNQDRVWRAETGPRYELGQMLGQVITFSPETGQDRYRYPYEEVESLGLIQDIKLLELLLRAQKGL